MAYGNEVPRWEARTLINSPSEVEVHGYRIRRHRSRQDRVRGTRVDEQGKALLVRPAVPGARLHLIASLPPCTVGMETCSGAHHWARLLQAHAHAVRLMAAKFVAPHRMSGARQERRG